MKKILEPIYIFCLFLTFFAGVYTILSHLHLFLHHENEMLHWVGWGFIIFFLSILAWGATLRSENK